MENKKLAILGGTPVINESLAVCNNLGPEETAAVAEVMKNGIISDFIGRAGEKFLGGRKVLEFEKEICSYFKTKQAVSFNSATTALQAAIAALGIGPGDEVITSPFTMTATASAILLNGAVPVFADIDEDNFCLSAESVEKNITKNTKAILTVNIFGGSTDFDKILPLAKKYGLKLIEDNSQAIGAKYNDKYLGTIGDIGILSFNVHKHLQCGEGGVLMTNDDHLAFRAQLVRNHGEVVVDDLNRPDEIIIGSNYRLSELHAAIALEQLKKIEQINGSRIQIAERLSQRLVKYDWLKPPQVIAGTSHVYYIYPIKLNVTNIGIKRSTVCQAMAAEGFPLIEGYTKPLYLLPLYQKKQMYFNSNFPFASKDFSIAVSYEKGICPVTERLHERDLVYSNILNCRVTEELADKFVEAIDKIDKHKDSLADYEKCKK